PFAKGLTLDSPEDTVGVRDRENVLHPRRSASENDRRHNADDGDSDALLFERPSRRKQAEAGKDPSCPFEQRRVDDPKERACRFELVAGVSPRKLRLSECPVREKRNSAHQENYKTDDPHPK